MEKLLNLIFIPECIFCHEEGSFFCDKCLNSCKRLEPVGFRKSRHSNATFLFVYEYERFIRECIRKAKYKNRQFAALKVLARKICDELTLAIKAKIDSDKAVIVPIPVSKAKLRKRGFNQAELIAQIFSKKLEISLKTSMLLRTKETAAQYSQNKKQRFENMSGAFTVPAPTDVKNAIVLVIDDICTTGATFLEASKTLFAAGAKDVICIALARKSLAKTS